MKNKSEKIEIGDEVLTPDGHGRGIVTGEEEIGEFRIITQDGEFYYYPEDLQLIKKGGGQP